MSVTKIPSSHQFRMKPIQEEDSVPRTCTTSLRSGSSHFVDIESGSADSDEFNIGQVYDDKKGSKQKLSLYVVTHNFQFKVVRSSTTGIMFIAFMILAIGNSVLTRSLIWRSCGL